VAGFYTNLTDGPGTVQAEVPPAKEVKAKPAKKAKASISKKVKAAPKSAAPVVVANEAAVEAETAPV